jgi:hypothetical protein
MARNFVQLDDLDNLNIVEVYRNYGSNELNITLSNDTPNASSCLSASISIEELKNAIRMLEEQE